MIDVKVYVIVTLNGSFRLFFISIHFMNFIWDSSTFAIKQLFCITLVLFCLFIVLYYFWKKKSLFIILKRSQAKVIRSPLILRLALGFSQNPIQNQIKTVGKGNENYLRLTSVIANFLLLKYAFHLMSFWSFWLKVNLASTKELIEIYKSR